MGEFPAVSQSRLEFWKGAQYTRSGMWWFTLFFGFIGLHHLLLRSPQTAIIVLLVNMFTFGYWYWWDLIQLSKQGLGTEGLNEFGMDSPWKAMGIAQGMWIPEGSPLPETKDGPPSPWWFIAYSLLLPMAPLAEIIAGDTTNAFTRFLYLTVIPFGFIMFAITLLADYWQLLMNPASLCLFGTKRYFPFTFFGLDKDGHSPRITGAIELKPCPSDNILVSLMRIMLPILKYVLPPDLIQSIEVALGIVKTGIQTAKDIAETGVKVATAVGSVATQIPAAASKSLALASNPQALLATAAKSEDFGKMQMQGGGRQGQDQGQSSPIEYATIGTLIAVVGGGILLAAGRSLNADRQNDSPPNPRDV